MLSNDRGRRAASSRTPRRDTRRARGSEARPPRFASLLPRRSQFVPSRHAGRRSPRRRGRASPRHSRGRLHAEPESASRTCFQRDRDRIIHSAAFRRLEYKTQVFVNHEGDFFRTRLTHSLEVSQIARSICRALRLNEDLAEALALAHDLGHPPFGHAGEDALKEMMEPFGGFDHNAQSLRVVTKLEQRYAEFDGLNLTWETLEGVVKHNGPLVGRAARAGRCRRRSPSTSAATTWSSRRTPAPRRRSPRSPTTSPTTTTTSTTACAPACSASTTCARCRWSARCSRACATRYPGIEASRLIHESVRRLIGHMVDDLIAETRRRIAEIRPDIGGRRPPLRPAGRGVLRGNAGERPGAEGVLAGAHVPALQAQSDDQQGATAGEGPVSVVRRRTGVPADRMAAARPTAPRRRRRRASSPTTSPG